MFVSKAFTNTYVLDAAIISIFSEFFNLYLNIKNVKMLGIPTNNNEISLNMYVQSKFSSVIICTSKCRSQTDMYVMMCDSSV